MISQHHFLSWMGLKSHIGSFIYLDELIDKSILLIGTGFTPNHRSCLILDPVSILVDIFTVQFHIALLKVCGKTKHTLIIW
jgi:hypothetical protein